MKLPPLIGARIAAEEHISVAKRSQNGSAQRCRCCWMVAARKDAASALGLTARTVHDCVTKLDERFD
jgi:hypothetical protein